MAPTLPDMPVEIFHAIIDEMLEDEDDRSTRRRDMQSLRQVCRTIEAKTRVRYGQEVFARRAVYVTPDSLAKIDAILSDELFRECIRDITVLIDHSGPSSCDDVDWDALLGNVDKTTLQQHLEKMFQRSHQVKRIAIDSPSLSSDASTELRKRVEDRWDEVVTATLDAIMAQQRLCFEHFEIGCCSPEAVPISARLLKGLSKSTTALAMLRDLFLYHFVADPDTEAEHDPQSTQNLADFLMLAPKLEFLWCQGIDLSAGDSIAALPPLNALGLSDISTTEANLTESLLLLSSTLESLHLRNIGMTAGSWRVIFHAMWHKLELKNFCIGNLIHEGDHQHVVFDEVYKERPLIWDPQHDKPSDLLQQELAEYRFLSPEYDARQKAVLEDFSDGWVFISQNDDNPRWLDMSTDDNDDIKMWLAMVEDRHQLITAD